MQLQREPLAGEHYFLFSNRANYNNRAVWIHYCVCTVTVKSTGLSTEPDGCRFPIPERVSREESMNLHLELPAMFDHPEWPGLAILHNHENVDGR